MKPNSIPTPFRNISVSYLSDKPLTPYEKKLIKAYTKLHEGAAEVKQKHENQILMLTDLHNTLPPLWKDFHDLRMQALNVLPNVFFDSMSIEPISVYIPTEQEMQERVDALNVHLGSFFTNLSESNKLSHIAYSEMDNVELVSQKVGRLCSNFDFEIYNELEYNQVKYSINAQALIKDWNEFEKQYRALDDYWEIANDSWNKYSEKYALLSELWIKFGQFITNRFEGDAPAQDEQSADLYMPQANEELQQLAASFESENENGITPYRDTDEWNMIINRYFHFMNYANATLAIEKALEQHPGNEVFMIRSAELESSEHRYKNALDILAKVEAKGKPYHPGLHYAKATVYKAMKMNQKAIDFYNKTIASITEETLGLKKLALQSLNSIYREEEKYDECIPLLKKCLSLAPNDDFTANLIGNTYLLNNQPDEAVKFLEKFLNTNKRSFICFIGLGDAFRVLNQSEKALKKYLAALAIAPDLDEPHFKIGAIMKEQNNLNDAIISYEDGLLNNQFDWTAHCDVAELYIETGNPEAARTHYRQVLSVNPDFKRAFDGLKDLPNE